MKYVLLPVLCLFVNLLPAATLEMTGESFAPMIYAHRNGRGRVLEMSDSSEILSREPAVGRIRAARFGPRRRPGGRRR